MTRITVLVSDRQPTVDPPLLSGLLARWAERAGAEVAIEPIAPAAFPGARGAASASSDGLLVDTSLVEGRSSLDPGGAPIVYVDLAATGWRGRDLGGRVVYGRGIDTYVWAARHLAARLRAPATTVPYGMLPDQFGELRTPQGPGPHPVVVLVHGGFWRAHWQLDLMDDLAIDLAAAGYASWNIEYRRGPGAWRQALDDVATAIDHLPVLKTEHGLAVERTALVGHSAGGHLVLWAAGRRRHDPTDATADPTVVVPLAPVSDLADCARRGLGEGAAAAFLDSMPEEDPRRYRLADPMQRLPAGVPTVVVQGLADGPDLIDHNRRFAAVAAAAGEQIELVELIDTDHFHVIDPTTSAWAVVRRRLGAHLREEAR